VHETFHDCYSFVRHNEVVRGKAVRWAACAVAICAVNVIAQSPPEPPTIFDSNPNHLWNRTYACLLMRQDDQKTGYGADALDPPLWPLTRYLLTGDSHPNTLRCLDEFLHSDIEHAERDPLKRSILQHDLWAVFDWAAAGQDFPRERRELEGRLAQAIRRLALTRPEIRALPDTYAVTVAARGFAADYDPLDPPRPFLPPDLFNPNGPWVCISAYGDRPTALVHFSGRSRFLVFIRLPGGREATLAYVQKLRSWPDAPIVGELLNLSLPQFPAGTKVALVRQAMLLDAAGKLTPTALTESVQIRIYRKITPGPPAVNYLNGPASKDQDFFEFRISRPLLFSQRGGSLVAVRPGDSEHATFSTHGDDPFESGYGEKPGPILQRCRSCHSDSGIHSVQSRIQWMHNRPGSDAAREATAWETDATIRRKQQERDFQLLEGLWRSERL
jgi:hypothetical protein